VGRAAEIAQVMRAAAEAAGGRSRLVLVAGEAGTGKTALVSHVWGRLAADGWTVAAGRCPEDEGAPPGWPWAEALRQLAGSVAPADLVPLRPLLEERLPRAGGPPGDDDPPKDDDPPAARFRLHQAISSCLEAVGRDRPFLVILDDLHRADGETLAILVSVCAALTTSKILLVATYRPADAGDALTGCLATLAEREPARITLAGLDDGAAAELIRATCHRAVDDPTVRVLVERTGANAFFLKEMSRLVDAEGALAATTEVPAGVRDVLQRRIARLPAGAQSILRQAAVIGTEASVDVLADVSGAADDALLDAVEAGLITGLVTEPAAGRIRFSHALVRDTLYGGLSRLRRSRLHARAAQAIERRSPGEVAALAHHFTRAGTDPGAAARYSRLAAEQAEQRFAYVEAAQLWEQALACLDQASTAAPRDRLELLLGLVRALSQAGQLARARSWRRDAIQAALPLGDPALLAQVITAFDVPMLWSAKEYGVTEQDLVDTVEQTLSRLPDGDQPLRSRLLATLAFELDGAGSARGDQASAEGVEMARRLGDRGTLTMAINGRFIQTFRGDGLDERLRLGAELLALGELPVTAEALAHLMLMVGYSGTGDFSAADRHADQAERITARYDLPASRAGFYRAMRAGLAGDPSAEERYRQAAEQMSPLGMWQHGAALSVLGRFCLLAGQGRLAEIAPELEPLYHYPPWSPVIAELYALTLAAGGQPAEARAVAGRPGPIRRDTFWLSMVAVRGLLALAIGDRERAESSYQALQPYAGRPAGAETGVMTLGPAAQILGDLARYLDLTGAEDHYRQALALGERAGVRAWTEAARQRLPLTPAQH
jgi:tetratricopeptide (TPR) repeat protein